MMKPNDGDYSNVRRLVILCGSLAVALPGAMAQETAPPPSETSPATPGAPAPASQAQPEDEDVVTLSPFVVDASRDIGYYAENTLAGSRLNSNVSDLAAAITVVTKQQLLDTGSTDVNDVFLYEANTEGVGNFTQTHGSSGMGVDRSTIKDVAAGYGWGNNPNAVYTASTANRVRGIASPDPAQNYYSSIARIPWDSYNTSSVEINRGPNSVLFGIGSPAGIVNQTTTMAAIGRDSGEVELRWGSWDSYRGSVSFNKTLVDDKLAIFGAALYDEKGFQRKPSEDTTRRQYIAMTFQPFRKTQLRASYENYDNFSRRPNYLTPRDFVSPWYADGRPVFNPVTRMVTYMDTGVTKGPYVFSSTSPGYNASLHVTGAGTGTAPGQLNANGTINNADNMLVGGVGYGVGHPLYVKSLEWTDYSRAVLAVYEGEGSYYGRQVYTGTVAPFTPPAIAARTPADWALIERRTTQSSAFRFAPTYVNANGTLTNSVSPYVLPGVTDKSVYNWEKVNINSMNFGESEAETLNVEFEQEILPDLHLQLGWFHQEMEASSNYALGQQTGATLFVDTNTHLTNGQPNPYFGMPYVSDLESDTYTNPEENDNIRATLAYEFDFTKSDRWTRWLGRHRLMGLWTEQDRKQFATRSRFAVIPPSDPRYINTTFTNANYNYASQSTQASRRYFYLGERNGTPGQVTQSAGFWGNPGKNGGGGPTSGVIPTYNWTRGAWEDANVTLSTETWHPGTGGAQRRITSVSAALQSYFWNDRIIATLGWREDDYRSRLTPGAINGQAVLTDTAARSDWYQGGLIRAGNFYNEAWGDWQYIKEDTMTKGIVLHALRWDDGQNQLSFHYNESDNFTAPQSATFDFFSRPLANPGGDGKDYGVSVTLFDRKLVARLNWFETSSINERVSNNLLQRTVRFDTAIVRGWAEAVVRYLGGEDITFDFANAGRRPLTADQENRMEQLTGLDNTWPSPLNISDTQDLKAEGIEFQLIYNPRPNWNIKFTGGKQDTKYSNTNQVWDSWVNGEGARLAFYQNLRVPQAWIDAAPADRRNLENINVTYGPDAGSATTPMSLTNFWSGSFGFPGPGDTQIRQDSGSGWTTPSGYWERAVETEIATAQQFEGRSATNQRKWRWNVITNYRFEEGLLNGFTVGGGVRWEDKAIAGYYGTFDRDGDGTVGPTELVMERSDLTRPITVSAETHVDFWVSYNRRLFNDRIGWKVQLNVRDALEEGGLTPVFFNLDGTAAAFRIVDPRQIYVTSTFSF